MIALASSFLLVSPSVERKHPVDTYASEHTIHLQLYTYNILQPSVWTWFAYATKPLGPTAEMSTCMTQTYFVSYSYCHTGLCVEALVLSGTGGESMTTRPQKYTVGVRGPHYTVVIAGGLTWLCCSCRASSEALMQLPRPLNNHENSDKHDWMRELASCF